MKDHNIDTLILKSFTGKIKNEESVILENWLSQSEENIKDFDAYKKLWEKSERLVYNDVLDVESALSEVKKKLPGVKTGIRWMFYIRQAAAILLLSVLFTAIYQYVFHANTSVLTEQTVNQEVKSAYGTQTKIELADGTNVWLNSGSTLRFPSSFGNLAERKVILNGEGFFDVAENAEVPFIVNTSKIGIKVFGTSFNVSAYNDYKTATIALVEGKVSLVKDYDGVQKTLIRLEPNDVVIYNADNNKFSQSKESHINRYGAWKNGQIVFFNDPIDVVVKRLEKWYNVRIEIGDEELQTYRFTATFIDESLEQVLNLLSKSSPIKYTIIQAKKQDNNTFSMRKVVLHAKSKQ